VVNLCIKLNFSFISLDPAQKGKVDKEIIVGDGLLKPEGLACDWVNDNIYWTDSETKRIEVSSMPGNGKQFHRNVLVWEDVSLPRAIAVAPYDGLMFWTDWGTPVPKIERASMDGKNRKILVETDLEWPNGLTLDYEKKLLYWIDAKLQYIAVVDWDGYNR
jgi:low density lipoprotein receptor-related protein 5/6